MKTNKILLFISWLLTHALLYISQINSFNFIPVLASLLIFAVGHYFTFNYFTSRIVK
jgi:hypothetical protein